MCIHKSHLTNMPVENMNQRRQITKVRRDRTQTKYKALGMTGLSLKVTIKAMDHHTQTRYTKERPDLISALITTAVADFATPTEREIAEAEQVATINVKTGEQTA